MSDTNNRHIAVVIPCFRVKKHILDVISKIGTEVCCIYVIDDCCPENSGDFVKNNCADSRVIVIKNEVNKGVGGAVMRGYTEAIKGDAEMLLFTAMVFLSINCTQSARNIVL